MEARPYFESQARECRRLANHSDNRFDKGALLSLARHYDGEALRAAPAKRAPGA